MAKPSGANGNRAASVQETLHGYKTFEFVPAKDIDPILVAKIGGLVMLGIREPGVAVLARQH